MTVQKSTDLIKAPDTHANRPAVSAVPKGALYPCTTHGIVYRSDGTTWANWAALPPPGGAAGQVLTKNSGTDGDWGWGTASGGGGSTILACTARTASATYSISSTTESDVDAANLAVTFVAPTSGKVLVEYQVWSVWSNTSGNQFWTVRNGTTTVASCSMSPSQTGSRQSASFYISGLTPGQSYTYKWGWKVASTGTASMYMGGNASIDGPAVMKVLALP